MDMQQDMCAVHIACIAPRHYETPCLLPFLRHLHMVYLLEVKERNGVGTKSKLIFEIAHRIFHVGQGIFRGAESLGTADPKPTLDRKSEGSTPESLAGPLYSA